MLVSMIDRIGQRRPPRIYLREWMDKLEVNNKKLAERMDRAESTVSKLLAAADPDARERRIKQKVTVEYLAEFAAALDVTVEQLFRHPNTPSRDELLRGYSDAELTSALQLIQHSRANASRSTSDMLASADDAPAKGEITKRRAS